MTLDVSSIGLHPVVDGEAIKAMRADYLATLGHPLDDFLDGSFIKPAEHLEIRIGTHRAGMLVRNQQGRLLLFHLLAEYNGIGDQLFDAIVAGGNVDERYPFHHITVSTGDPFLLSNALRVGQAARVSDYLFGEPPDGQPPPPAIPPLAGYDLVRAEAQHLAEAVSFCRRCVPTAADWLDGYLDHLIERGELLLVRAGGDIRGSGELRRSDEQPPFAHLGMIVDPAFRRQGLATFIMRTLRHECRRRGLRSVCSTRVDNDPARFAIERAGFIPVHRVLDITVFPRQREP